MIRHTGQVERHRSRAGGAVAQLVALAVAALVASGCSGSDVENANLVPLDAPAPGVLYVSTVGGDLQQVTPESEQAEVFAVATDAADGGDVLDDGAIVGVARSGGGSGLIALVQPTRAPGGSPAVPYAVGPGRLTPLEVDGAALTCLDSGPVSESTLAHEAVGGDANGIRFEAVVLEGDTAVPDVDLVSVACPKWTSDRSMVATALPTRSGDPSSIATIVQTSDARYDLAFEGCGTTPTGFSPDDRTLALAVTCYSSAWAGSGLYLVPVDDLGTVGDLRDLTEIGDGLFGATAWHADGGWVAAVHAEAIDEQNIAQDLASQPRGLRLFELATGQTLDLPLAEDAAPFSIAWLDTPVGP